MSYITPRKVLGHLDRLSAWQRGETPAPVTVEIDLSNACSLRCFGCHMAHTHQAGPWMANPAEKPADYSATGKFADEALIRRALGEMASAGVQAVVWSGGGEPTLHPRFAAIVAHAHAQGLQQGVYTLGGHVTSAIEAVAPCLSWAVVSLDGADAETYAAEKGVPTSRFFDACQGVQRLIAAGCSVVGVSFLLHEKNWTQALAMLGLARGLGATYVTFRPLIEVSMARPSEPVGDHWWIDQALSTLRDLAKEPDVEIDPDRFLEYADWSGHGYPACHGIKLVTQVTPDGRVWVCPNRRGMPGSELGDLSRESFAAIWARHPGQWTDFRECRVMCRLHLTNRELAPVFETRRHEAFV